MNARDTLTTADKLATIATLDTYALSLVQHATSKHGEQYEGQRAALALRERELRGRG